MIYRTAKYGARLSLIAENQVVTLSRHPSTLKGLVAEAYGRAYRLCRRSKDTLTIGPLLCGLWNYYINGADFRRGENIAERLLALAETSSPLEVRLPAYKAVGQTRLFTSAPAAAHDPIDAVLARWLLGDRERAAHHFEAGSAEWLAAGSRLIQPYHLGLLAQAHGRGG